MDMIANRFVNAGFSPELASEGVGLVRENVNAGHNQEAAMKLAYRKLLKNAAAKEQAMGVMGNATALTIELDRRDQITRRQIRRLQAKIQGS